MKNRHTAQGMHLPAVAARLLRECTRETGFLAGWIALMILSAALRIRFTRLLGYAGDAALAGNAGFFTSQLGIIALLAGGSIAASVAIAYVSGRYKAETTARLSAKTARCITGAQYGWLQHQKSGDLIQRASSDTAMAADLINGWLPDTVNAVIQVAMAAYFIISVDWRLALAYFGAFPLAVLGQTLVAKPIERTRLKALDAASEAKSLVSDTLHRVDTVKAYSLEETMVQRTVAKLDAFFHLDLKSNRVYCAVVPCGFVCAFLPSMLLYVVAIALAIRGTVSVGQLMAMVSLTTNVDSILLMLGQLMANVRTQSAGSQRIFGLWDAPQEKRGSLHPARESGDAVRLEGICFGYDGQQPLMEDLTLSLAPGERVAVVGASGSGKSTLLKLIAGLYAPQAGRIMVDGRDAGQMGVDELRTRLSYMSQDSHIFQGTLRENVAYGKPGASDGEIVAALRDAGLGDWLAELPQGLDTPLGDMGSILSGGQRQRIAMARCMIHDAPLFLLDEATSALDNQTEREVLETLGKLLEGKSALLVTHRLSALRGITRVLVLDKGRIVEDGAPQALMELRGLYYQLYRQQQEADL